MKLIKKILQKIKNYVARHPFLKKIVVFVIPKKILEKILVKSFSPNTEFDIFFTTRKKIKFALEPLTDTRGIGRVAKEQYAYFLKNASKEPQANLDTIHFYSSIHWCPKILPKNSVVMIHDVIPMVFPELFSEASKIWQNRFYHIAKQAKAIITISQTSKNDIIKYLDIDEKIIHIVNNGVTKLDVAKSADGIKLPSEYFVYLGSYDHHKNLDIILEALSILKSSKYKLVMIGDNIDALDKVKKLNLTDRVHFLGKLDDKQMALTIQNSIALLFPSLYEGFGLPPMEAALLNIASICSNRPTMNEFLYDAVLFADPYDAKQWAAHMQRLATDIDMRDRYATLANKRVLNFTWDDSCSKLLKTLEAI